MDLNVRGMTDDPRQININNIQGKLDTLLFHLDHSIFKPFTSAKTV